MAQLQQYQQQREEQLAFQELPQQDNYHNQLQISNPHGKQYSGANQEIVWFQEGDHDAENSNVHQIIPSSELHKIQGQTRSSSEIIHISNEDVSNSNQDSMIYKNMQDTAQIQSRSQNTAQHSQRQRASKKQQNEMVESFDESEDQDHQHDDEDDEEEEKQMMQPNFLEFCTFCQKLNGYDSFNQLLNKALYQKYPLSQNKFYARGVEEILRGESTLLVINFRDKECFEIDEEYLKRFYPRQQQFQKMFDLTAFYKYQKDIPRLFMQQLGHIMTYYHDHRRKIEYKKIKKQLNLENKEDQTESEQMSEEESEEDNEQENENDKRRRNTGERENSSDKNTSSKGSKDKQNDSNKNKNNKVLPKECEHVLENIDMTVSFHERISQQQQQQQQQQDSQLQKKSKGYKLPLGGEANDINAYYFFYQAKTKKQELADGFDAESFIRKPSNLHFKPQLKRGEILLSKQLANQSSNNQIINNNTSSSYSLSQLLQNQQSMQTDLSISQMNQLLFTEQSSEDNLMLLPSQQLKNNQHNHNSSSQQEAQQHRLLLQIQGNHHQHELQMMNFSKVKNNIPSENVVLASSNAMMRNNNPAEQVVLSSKLKQQQQQQSGVGLVSHPFQSSGSSNNLQSKAAPSAPPGQLISKPESAKISLASSQLQDIQPSQAATTIQKSQLKQQSYPQKVPLFSEGYQQQQISQTKLSSLIMEQQQKNTSEINLPSKNSGAQAAASAAIARLTQQANQLAALKATGEQAQQQQFLISQQFEAMRGASNERENDHLEGRSNSLREQQQQHILSQQQQQQQQQRMGQSHNQLTYQYQRENTNPIPNTANFPARDPTRLHQMFSSPEPLNSKSINILKGTQNNYAETQTNPNSNASTVRNHSNDPSLQSNTNQVLQAIRNNKLSSTVGRSSPLENNQDQHYNNMQAGSLQAASNLQRSQNDNNSGLAIPAKIALSMNAATMTARQPGASSVLRSQPQFSHSRTASGNATPDNNNNTTNLQLLQQQQLLILQQLHQQQQQQQQQQSKLPATDTFPNSHPHHTFSQSQSDQLLLSLKQTPVVASSLSSKVTLSSNNTTNSKRYVPMHSQQQGQQYSAGSSLPSSSGGTPAHTTNIPSGEERLKKKKEGIVLNSSNCNGSSGGVSLINPASSSYKNNIQGQGAADVTSSASSTKIQPVAIMNKGLSAGVLSLHSDRNQGRRGWGSQQSEQQQQQQTNSNFMPSQRTDTFQQSASAANSAFFNAKRNSKNNNFHNPENRQDFLAMTQLPPYSSPNSSSFFNSSQKNRSASNYQRQQPAQQLPCSYANNQNTNNCNILPQEIASSSSSSQVKHQNFVGASASECAVNLQQLLKASQNRTEQLTNNNTNARLKNNSQSLLHQQQQQELLLLNKPVSNISMHQRIVSSQSSHAASASSIIPQPLLTPFSQAAALLQYSQLLQQKQSTSSQQSQSLSSSLLNKNNAISPFNSSPLNQTHVQHQQQLAQQSQYNQLQNQYQQQQQQQDSESNVQTANGRTRSQEIISRNTNHSGGVNTARSEYEQYAKNYPYPTTTSTTQRHPIVNGSDQNTPQLMLLKQSQLAQTAGLKSSNNPSKERIASSSQSSSAHFAESIKRLISQNIHQATTSSKGTSTSAALSSMQQQKILQSHPQQFQLSMAQPSPQPQVSSYSNNNNIIQSSSPTALKKYNNMAQTSSNSQRSQLTTATTAGGNHSNNRQQQQQQQHSSLVRINPQSSNNTLNNLGNASALTTQSPPYQQQQASQQLTNSMVNHNYSVSSQIFEHLRQQSTHLLSQTARPSLNTPFSRNNSPQKLLPQQPDPQFFLQQKQFLYEQEQQYNRQFQQQPQTQQLSQGQVQLQHQQQQRFQSSEKLQPSYNNNYAVNSYPNRLPSSSSSVSVHQPASVAQQNLPVSQSRPTSTQRSAATKQINSLVRFRQNQQQQ